MHLRVGETSIDVAGPGGALAGRYVFDDPYKPYLHPLFTPSGVPMSCFMPHDHKHHRALMYALRTPELNFWEEYETLPGEKVGRQVHRGLVDLVAEGESVGFTQQLDWCEQGSEQPVLREVRKIACAMGSDGRGFAWSWRATFTAMSDLTLRMSQWSSPRGDGTLVNYHGLGLRLPREFGGPQADLRVFADGAPTSVAEAMGTMPSSVAVIGAADGYWPVRYGGVRFTQGQGNALFIMRDSFAYVSMGPSNLAPRQLRQGDVLEEDYVVDVFDADPRES